ncbi:MAG: acid phosphatase [Caulobacteraceae bacterium]
MRLVKALSSAILLLIVAGAAGASAPRGGGYLNGHEPDVLAVIPQPPAPGSPRDRADRAIFRQTRGLEGTPRWRLAQSDADLFKLLGDFSCAVGVTLTREDVPRLMALIIKAAPDISAAYNTPKDIYRKARPFTRDAGDICVPRSSGFAKSFDYPSGHATWSWAVGLILARAAPDRAGQILGRARAFGESRVVCGVHNASAVAAGRLAADTVVSALEGDEAFRSDLAAARVQLSAVRAAGPRPDLAVCRAEGALGARTPW